MPDTGKTEWQIWQEANAKKAEIRQDDEGAYMGTVAAKWGSKTFLVSENKIMPLTELTTSFKIHEEVYEAKDTQPSNIKTSRELIPLTLESVLVRRDGINVREQIERWVGHLEETHYLELGGKPFGPPYKLKEVNTSEVILADNGVIMSAKLDLVFVEDIYFDLTTLTPEELAKAPVKYFSIGAKVRIKTSAANYAPPSNDPNAKAIKIENWAKEKNYTITKLGDDPQDPTKALVYDLNKWVYIVDLSLIVQEE